jgi:hypothetical protein
MPVHREAITANYASEGVAPVEDDERMLAVPAQTSMPARRRTA